MFARRPVTATPAPRPAPPSSNLTSLLAKPYVGAGGAAAMILLAGAALILIAGDPHAGAPSVRISLDSGDKGAPHAGGPGASPIGPGGVSLDGLKPGQEVAMPGADDPVQGQVVITLPQGASLGGASPSPPGLDVAAPGPRTPLPRAPIAGLTAPGPGGGLLPIVAKNGLTPFQAYARPFHDNGKPKVALVIGGLGLNAAATRAAIERLPPEVTLSFVPYADGLQSWIDLARANGHEVLLEIPMEPLDYPNNDPGPYTLMANAPPGQTVKRLEWLLSRATGYFGVTNYLGGRFVNADGGMAAFTWALKGRGLGFLDDGSAAHRGPGVPRASADSLIDEQLSADSIDHQLLGLEARALQRGSAFGAGFAYPVTIAQVTRWAQGLAGRGYQLAPASALARK